MGADIDLRERLSRLRVSAGDERRSHVYRSHPDDVPRLHVERLSRREAGALCGALNERLRNGEYCPAPVYVVPCPKRDGSARAHLVLTVEDRIVYEALVRPTRRAVEAALCPRDLVFGPRGTSSVLRWTSFLRSPLRSACRHVVMADVVNAWGSMPHRAVAVTLLSLGCDRPTTGAIGDFLGTVTGADRGLPTRVGATECLATALLSNVDRQMADMGWRYSRCADDMLIAVDTELQGAEALQALSAVLGPLGLAIREDRTGVVERHVYEQTESLGWADRVWERASELGDGRYLYGEAAATVRAVLRRLRSGHRARTSALVAAREVMTASVAPRRKARVLSCALELLTSARDPALLPLLGEILTCSPDLTPLAARYVRRLAVGPAPGAALDACATLMREQDLFDTQRAWLHRGLLPVAGRAGRRFLAMLEEDATSPHANWVLRTEAARMLMAGRPGSAPVVCELAVLAPPQFSGELDGIAHGRGLSLAC